ncbi:MAG: hypothetical protein JWN67_1348 [Actinomycetia bacterium]|nr:hypothetical protein [Actinomycetes bacterium]
MQRTPRTTNLLKASLTAVGALALVGASFTGTAFATGDHGAKSDSRSTWTEDNDTNDGGTPNNVADAGDNRHPSGKDRSVEKGGSGTQGRSGSDPDGMTNGGADKPNGTGGYDKADQDGNNGCGNDDDFEDDNNGNCGGKAHQKAETSKPAKAESSKDCTCSHATTTTVKPAKAAKVEKSEHAKPAKAEESEHAKPAKAEHAKAEHGSTTCDRRNDERDQRAVRTDQHKADSPKTETVTPATPVTVPTVATPAASAAATPATPAPAVPGEVLSNSAVAAPASVESPTIPGEVLAAEAVAPAVPAKVTPAVATRSGGNVLAAAASGALAFTGMNLFTLLGVALLTIAVGWFLLRADRKRSA